jgi:hypothetical protein
MSDAYQDRVKLMFLQVTGSYLRDQGRRVFALAVVGATAQRLGMDLGENVETMTLA